MYALDAILQLSAAHPGYCHTTVATENALKTAFRGSVLSLPWKNCFTDVQSLIEEKRYFQKNDQIIKRIGHVYVSGNGAWHAKVEYRDLIFIFYVWLGRQGQHPTYSRDEKFCDDHI